MLFDAFGRYAFGQISGDPSFTTVVLPQAASTGVAGTIGGEKVDKTLTPALGIGIAGVLIGGPAGLLIGAPSIGVAGALSGTVTPTFIGASSTGVAGKIGPSATLSPAVGIGVAGAITGPKIFIGIPPAVSTGTVGSLVPTVPVSMPAAVSTGVAGLLTFPTIGCQITQAAGIGLAGRVTVNVSGGGTSGDSDQPRRKKPRSGLEPVAKRPPPKPKPAAKEVLLPPEWLGKRKAPSLVPAEVPVGPSDPDFAEAMPAIAQQIMDAQDISDVMQRLREEDYDAQDLADIADVLALI